MWAAGLFDTISRPGPHERIIEAHCACIREVWRSAISVEESEQVGTMMRQCTHEDPKVSHDVLHQKYRAVPLSLCHAEVVLSQV